MRFDLQQLQDVKVKKSVLLFFFWILAYKVALEAGYWLILADKVQYFQGDFSIAKYFIGIFWVTLLFFNIRHEERKVSSFLLNLQLVIAIIPITVVYALCNESSIYYNVLCLAFLIAECMVKGKWREEEFPLRKIERLPYLIFIGCILIIFGMLGYAVITNGLPPLTALNLKDVYELRGEEYFITNQYINYAYTWIMVVLLPFILALFLVKRKYVSASICALIALMLFLYSGNKTNLFLIPLIIGTYIFARFRDTNYRFYGFFTLGLGLTIPLATVMNHYMSFSLFVRRTLIIPANLKFVYYDFFSTNPKLGLGGTLWGSKLGIPYPYDERIGYIISEKYFNLPEMNSNTGFLAEGFARFGFVGIFLSLILFALVLMLLDRMQRRSGYTFAVTMSVYPIFTLNDAQLIDSLIFGPMLVLLFIILLYYDDYSKEGEEIKWKKRMLPRISI